MNIERPLMDVIRELHELRVVGLGPRVLVWLDTRKFLRARHAELIEELRVSKSTLTMVMRALESAGWVAKARPVEDSRKCHYYLTPAGVERVRAIDAAITGGI